MLTWLSPKCHEQLTHKGRIKERSPQDTGFLPEHMPQGSCLNVRAYGLPRVIIISTTNILRGLREKEL